MESVMPASFVQSVVPVEVDGTWGSIVMLLISALAKFSIIFPGGPWKASRRIKENKAKAISADFLEINLKV